MRYDALVFGAAGGKALLGLQRAAFEAINNTRVRGRDLENDPRARGLLGAIDALPAWCSDRHIRAAADSTPGATLTETGRWVFRGVPVPETAIAIMQKAALECALTGPDEKF